MAERRRIVVLGAMANMPVAGVVWQVLHYLEGLRRLGHHVVYVEDTGNWPYDPYEQTVTDDAGGAVRRLSGLLASIGMADDWAFCNAARAGEPSGMTLERLANELARADALINISGVTVLGETHMAVPVRIYLETDPVKPQIEVAQGNPETIAYLEAHTHHFTFGERLGMPGCTVPQGPFYYRPTRQPVILDWWGPAPDFPAPPAGPMRFTTIANWKQTGNDVEWEGEVYTWDKSVQFLRLLDLPSRVAAQLELALALDDDDTLAGLRAAGWRVVSAAGLSDDHHLYRDYIIASGGEVSAAKDQYVRPRSGWFSDRTATYLAAGRPAVVQDAGFDVALPTGLGLLAFATVEEAAAGVEEIAADYECHSLAAHEIAREFFRAETVLARMLSEAGL
ncbi:MAG: hypothetical protein WKF96_03015 [Solirubrobacteraceae bacterium]